MLQTFSWETITPATHAYGKIVPTYTTSRTRGRCYITCLNFGISKCLNNKTQRASRVSCFKPVTSFLCDSLSQSGSNWLTKHAGKFPTPNQSFPTLSLTPPYMLCHSTHPRSPRIFSFMRYTGKRWRSGFSALAYNFFCSSPCYLNRKKGRLERSQQKSVTTPLFR